MTLNSYFTFISGYPFCVKLSTPLLTVGRAWGRGIGLTLPVCIVTRAWFCTAAAQLVRRNLQRHRAVIPAIARLSCIAKRLHLHWFHFMPPIHIH